MLSEPAVRLLSGSGGKPAARMRACSSASWGPVEGEGVVAIEPSLVHDGATETLR